MKTKQKLRLTKNFYVKTEIDIIVIDMLEKY